MEREARRARRRHLFNAFQCMPLNAFERFFGGEKKLESKKRGFESALVSDPSQVGQRRGVASGAFMSIHELSKLSRLAGCPRRGLLRR